MSTILAAVMLLTDSRWSPAEDGYSWHGWYMVLVYGIWACGLFMLPAALAGALWRFVRNRKQRAGEVGAAT